MAVGVNATEDRVSAVAAHSMCARDHFNYRKYEWTTKIPLHFGSDPRLTTYAALLRFTIAAVVCSSLELFIADDVMSILQQISTGKPTLL